MAQAFRITGEQRLHLTSPSPTSAKNFVVPLVGPASSPLFLMVCTTVLTESISPRTPRLVMLASSDICNLAMSSST